MKKNLVGYLAVLILLLCFNSTNIGVGGVEDPIGDIAVILDTSACYDEYFLQDVIDGFDAINQTYQLNYSIFRLENYTVTNTSYYHATYDYFNSTASTSSTVTHTQLAKSLIDSGKFDLIAFIGYELRQIAYEETPLPELYPNTKFLFYDLSGEISSNGQDTDRNNVLRVSFAENEVGYMTGVLATATISSFPSKIAAVGIKPLYWIRGEPRSNQLMAGFQAGVMRQNPETQIDISYIDYYVNNSVAKTQGTKLETDGYELIFTALQNENTLGILDSFSKKILSVDSNRSLISGNKPFGSIVKNNTKALLATFELLNQSATYLSGDLTFGFQDDVLYPNGWSSNNTLVNNTMAQIYQDLVIDKITVPKDIILAQNTPGFEFITSFSLILLLSIIMRKRRE